MFINLAYPFSRWILLSEGIIFLKQTITNNNNSVSCILSCYSLFWLCKVEHLVTFSLEDEEGLSLGDLNTSNCDSLGWVRF